MASVMIFAYLVIGAIGIISISFPVSVEMLPPYIRPHITPYIATLQAIIGFIALKMYVDLIIGFQLGGSFVFFTVLGICTTVFIIIFVPETKNIA